VRWRWNVKLHVTFRTNNILVTTYYLILNIVAFLPSVGVAIHLSQLLNLPPDIGCRLGIVLSRFIAGTTSVTSVTPLRPDHGGDSNLGLIPEWSYEEECSKYSCTGFTCPYRPVGINMYPQPESCSATVANEKLFLTAITYYSISIYRFNNLEYLFASICVFHMQEGGYKVYSFFTFILIDINRIGVQALIQWL
jgi:hypothetical protein